MSKYGVLSGPNTGKYGPEITPYLETFNAVYDPIAEEFLVCRIPKFQGIIFI